MPSRLDMQQFVKGISIRQPCGALLVGGEQIAGGDDMVEATVDDAGTLRLRAVVAVPSGRRPDKAIRASREKKMPKKFKLKPRKALLKRIKLTANGKAIRGKVGLGHLCAKKSADRKRKLRRPDSIKANGIIQPILVRKAADGYRIIAGGLVRAEEYLRALRARTDLARATQEYRAARATLECGRGRGRCLDARPAHAAAGI